MQFADPRNDIAFKKIFGNENKKSILISFLNAVLDFKDKKAINEVQIVSSSQVPKIEEMKLTILDIKAKNVNGEEFIVEMQKRDLYDFTKRSLYYTSKAYVEQLDKKQNYDELKKVYFIGILNFDMFENENFISRHLILNQETLKQEIKDFEFSFIELNKFKKELSELTTTLDRWIYFIKNAQNFELIPKEYENIIEFKEAFELANQYTWNKEELKIYDWVALKEFDEENALRKAKDRAHKEGMQQGREEGLEQGREEGIEKGAKNKQIEIAKKLLEMNIDIKTIIVSTGLSADEINNIKEV